MPRREGALLNRIQERCKVGNTSGSQVRAIHLLEAPCLHLYSQT